MTKEVTENGGIHIHDIAGESDDWRDLAPGIQMRVLRTEQATGTWAVLYKVKAGTTASSHMHFGSSDSFVIKGKMVGGRTLVAGDYVFEPNSNRVHEAAYFEEDTLYLYIHKGPLMYLDEKGNHKAMSDWFAIQQIADSPAAKA
jgi:gentisate 1,2-dioxygenase